MDHSLTLNEQAEAWSFGDNSLGQLGRSTAISTPVENCVERVQGPLSKERVLQLGAGLGHSLAVVTQGRVYSWGWHQGECFARVHWRRGISSIRGGGCCWWPCAFCGSHIQRTSWGVEDWQERSGLGSPADERSPFPTVEPPEL